MTSGTKKSLSLTVLACALLAACGGGDETVGPDAGVQSATVGARAMHARVPGRTPGGDAAVAAADAAETSDATAAKVFATSRPFPHHTTYTSGVIKPNNVSQSSMDSKVTSLWNSWKTTYLRTSGGQGTWVKFDNTNSTVSEAHGYGMVLAAYMGDQSTFNSMYTYYTKHYSQNGRT